MRSSKTIRSSTLLLYSRPPPRLTNLNLGFPPTSHPQLRVTQHRPIFSLPSTLLTTTLGPTPTRHLTHTKTLPHPTSPIFTAISDIASYPNFLPFTLSSTVTSTHPTTNLPTRALLTVGYAKFALEEVWDSIVHCDPDSGIIEARSADVSNSNTDQDSLFEVLQTRWEIRPIENIRSVTPGVEHERGIGVQTSVKLDVDVKFRNPVYDQMFASVEERVAEMMIGAFEKRVEELDRRK